MATIIGPPGTAFEGRIYSLNMYCGQNYPREPPLIRFVTQLNVAGVNQGNGEVQRKKVEAWWNPTSTIYELLTKIRADMASPANRKNPQPEEGSEYA